MHSLMKYISRIHRCANTFRSASLKDTGLSGCQHIYIFHICKNPGISQEQLAALICVNKSNVTRQLGALEQSGYIRREVSEKDRRIQLVYPTSKAEEVFPKVRSLMREWNRLLTAELTEAEQETLVRILERMSERAVLLSQKGGGDL